MSARQAHGGRATSGRCALLGAFALSAAALSAGFVSPALAEQALPSWSSYTADREVRRGWQAWSQQRIAEAETAAQRATRLDPEQVDAWQLLGVVQAGRGAWVEVASAVQRLVALDPDSDTTWLLAGRVALERGLREEALAGYGRASELEPSNPESMLGFALVAARLDRDMAGAEARLLELRGTWPTFDLASLPLRDDWAVLKDDEPFLEALERVLKSRPAAPPR